MKPIKAPQITLQEMRLIARCRKSMEAAFFGGVNCYALPTEINASQCSDALNVWYRKQLVRTRPGVVAKTGVTDKSKATVCNDLMIKVLNVDPIHIPTIFTNCNSRGGGNAYEDRNIIQPRVKMSFTPSAGDKTFKLADANIDDEDIKIYYHCPERVKAENYIIPKGETTVPFTNDYGNSYTITIDRTRGLITWAYVSGNLGCTAATWPGFTDSATFNVIDELTFEYAKDLSADYINGNPISGCTMAQWYGGSLSGLGNGDCLVVSGNPLYPNKYWWSAMDDISYWPVNNFNSCGDKDEAITALAKQSNYLIAFTANKTYKITYNSEIPTNADVPYEEFPRSLLHSTIGCDCPDTIELVDNCLTWLNSDGTVYRIVSTSNKDQLCIVPLSQNISPLLKAIPAATMQVATSCHTDSYYIVFIDTQAFAWDYGDIPFVNSSDISAAQLRLAWYPWKFSISITNAFYSGGVIYLNGGAYALDETIATDSAAWFNAYVVSKDYDFDIPFEFKQVIDEWFTLSGDEGMSLTVEIKDDVGSLDYVETITGGSTETVTFKYNTQSQWTKHFQVAIRRVSTDNSKFGIDKVVLTANLGRDIGND